MKIMKVKSNKRLRIFTDIQNNSEGSLTTELRREYTGHISPRMKISDIIFTRRCRIVRPEKLVELCKEYFAQKYNSDKNIRVYVSGEMLTICYPTRKYEMNVLDFNPFSIEHKKIPIKQLLKIQREKQFILSRKEATMFKTNKNNITYLKMV